MFITPYFGAANIRIIFYLSTKILFFSTLSVDNLISGLLYTAKEDTRETKSRANIGNVRKFLYIWEL